MRLTRLASISLLAAISALAQFESATVLGTVSDPRSAAVPGSLIELKNTGTGFTQTAVTDERGEYRFLNVPIGRYQLQAVKAGFRTSASNPIELAISAHQRVDFRLEIASVETSVSVSAAAALVEADSSEHGQIVDATQIVQLPLNGRQYSQLIYLSTGTVPSPSSLGSGYSAREGSFNANGLRSVFNNFLLDGVDNNYFGTSNQGFSNQVVQPSPDSIAEFKVVTNNMSAEYGRSGGATVNVAMRSGANVFHGALWEFLRNTDLNAVGFFKPAAGKPTMNRNQFGADLGGPILKNRFFFFADYEGFRQVGSAVDFATLPTMSQRAGNIGLPMLNPLTGKTYLTGVIPSSDIISFAQQVLAALPAPTSSSAINNYQTLHRVTQYTDKGDLRGDFLFTNNLRGFARYSQSRVDIFDPGTISGLVGGDGNGNVVVPIIQTTGGVTWTISPQSMLEARFGFSRSRAGKTPVLAGGPSMLDLFGIPGLPTNPKYTGGITYQGFLGGFTSLGRQWTNPQYQYPTTWDPKVNYTRVLGRHNFKAGVEYQRVHVEQMDIHPVYGIDAYAGLYSGRFLPTFNSNSALQTEMYSFADFLLGMPALLLQASPEVANIRQWGWFGYLQDDFRVNSGLTLNLGLRYESMTPIFERDGRLSNYDPTTNSMLLAGKGSVGDRALVNPDTADFAPRLGAAYALDSKTALRGGYGLSYIHWNRVGSSYLTQNAPYAIVAQRTNLPGASFLFTQQGFPASLVSPTAYSPTEVTTQYMPKDSPDGRVQSWFFSVQRELTNNLLLDVAYVGNSSDNLAIINDINQAAPNQIGASLGVQQRRPNTKYASIVGTLPWGYGNYHGLQVKLEKRFSQGFYLLNSFTWSKTMDLAGQPLDGGGGCNNCGNDIPSVQDINNLKADYGPSAYHRPFVNVTSVVWEVPVGRGRAFLGHMNGVTDALLGGWQMSGVNAMRSGPPLTFAYDPNSAQEVSPTITVYGRNAYRPNITGDPLAPSGQRSYLNYFNTANFQVPSANAPFGSVGRNIVRGYAFYQFDLSLDKSLSITEKFKLQFRAEAFSLLNKTNFREPNTDVSSVSFGTVSSSFDPRQLQFALKLSF